MPTEAWAPDVSPAAPLPGTCEAWSREGAGPMQGPPCTLALTADGGRFHLTVVEPLPFICSLPGFLPMTTWVLCSCGWADKSPLLTIGKERNGVYETCCGR